MPRRLPNPATCTQVTGCHRLLRWGHTKLSQPWWIQSPVFAVDLVSQQSPWGLSFKIWPFLNPCSPLCGQHSVTLYYVYRMGKERHFQPGPSRQFEWTGKNVLPQPEEGGDKICSLTEATVTAMTRVETCYYFLVPLSWRQCQVSRTRVVVSFFIY